jgi:hypothetical protein
MTYLRVEGTAFPLPSAREGRIPSKTRAAFLPSWPSSEEGPLSYRKRATMTILEEQARSLMLALLDAGREPIWALLLVSWYLGDRAREAALAVIEERQALDQRL